MDVFLQFRIWDAGFGTDWQAAKAGGYYGETAILAVSLAKGFPGTVVWRSGDLTKFQAINIVPEPSTLMLVGLGLISSLLFRPKL
jgi:hypothetical protein